MHRADLQRVCLGRSNHCYVEHFQTVRRLCFHYRVSFYELLVDDADWQKQKSSGLMICPGTGSTSWHLNVNHVSFQAVQQILQLGKGLLRIFLKNSGLYFI